MAQLEAASEEAVRLSRASLRPGRCGLLMMTRLRGARVARRLGPVGRLGRALADDVTLLRRRLRPLARVRGCVRLRLRTRPHGLVIDLRGLARLERGRRRIRRPLRGSALETAVVAVVAGELARAVGRRVVHLTAAAEVARSRRDTG